MNIYESVCELRIVFRAFTKDPRWRFDSITGIESVCRAACDFMSLRCSCLGARPIAYYPSRVFCRNLCAFRQLLLVREGVPLVHCVAWRWSSKFTLLAEVVKKPQLHCRPQLWMGSALRLAHWRLISLSRELRTSFVFLLNFVDGSVSFESCIDVARCRIIATSPLCLLFTLFWLGEYCFSGEIVVKYLTQYV